MDVSWSPIHPALFATVDGNAKLSLWNLNSDTEVCLNLLFDFSIISIAQRLYIYVKLLVSQ